MSSKIHYRISAPDPKTHYFHVQIRIESPDPHGQQLRLPTWIPGSYLIREFAQHVQMVTATSAGKEIEVKKIDKCTWQCRPCMSEIIVVYKVYAFDRSVRSAYLDNTRAFFNGSSVFLAVVGQEDDVCSLQINQIIDDCAKSWDVACTYPIVNVDGQGYGEYRVENYNQLIDHPVEISKLSEVSFEVDNIPHRMVFTGSHQGDLKRLARHMARICAVHKKMFGALPVEQYLFMTLVGTNIYGGLEHRDSTALMCSQHELPQSQQKNSGTYEDKKAISKDYRRFLGLCSHEYFHLWNVKRIKPLAYQESDLSEEAYTRQLWIFEGITSYYDDLALVRSGVITPDSYLELVSETLNRVRNQAGRLHQSLSDSSFDTWIKFYRPNENTLNTVVSYYAKGSLTALALDLTLQTRTEGRVCLDDVMRQLWKEYGAQDKGVPEGEFERLCEQVSGVSLKLFFDSWVRGVGDQPITSLLLGVGIKSEGSVDRSELKITSNFGCNVEMRGPSIFVKSVLFGSAAEKAGLAAGDELVAFEGVKLNRVSLQNLYKQYKPGFKGELLVFRQERLLKLPIRLAEPLKQKWSLEIDAAVDTKVQKIRERWLWQEV